MELELEFEATQPRFSNLPLISWSCFSCSLSEKGLFLLKQWQVKWRRKGISLERLQGMSSQQVINERRRSITSFEQMLLRFASCNQCKGKGRHIYFGSISVTNCKDTNPDLRLKAMSGKDRECKEKRNPSSSFGQRHSSQVSQRHTREKQNMHDSVRYLHVKQLMCVFETNRFAYLSRCLILRDAGRHCVEIFTRFAVDRFQVLMEGDKHPVSIHHHVFSWYHSRQANEVSCCEDRNTNDGDSIWRRSIVVVWTKRRWRHVRLHVRKCFVVYLSFSYWLQKILDVIHPHVSRLHW